MVDRPVTGRCVNCGRPADLSPANPWRPFCSERCKLLDLGAWLDGSRSIPSEEEEPPDQGQ